MSKAALNAQDDNINNTPEDISNAASGHKAAISNPNVSEKAKEHSRQELERLGGEDAFFGKKQDDMSNKDPSRVVGGLKATINTGDDTNRTLHDEGRQSAREKLDDIGDVTGTGLNKKK